ncbi:MAG: hypothetical protein L0Y54_08650 [Sporichthyaceae bacterium]|nr:hypothetical protein [Sporichthyaceae bacterium]
MSNVEWVLLSYRIPREPSTPRITVWRKLERLGVARLGDGLVGLPADARTKEQIEWVAEEIVDVGGTATVWLASATSQAQDRAIAAAMRAARTAEYQSVIAQAQQAATGPAEEAARALRRLRAELRRIQRRDFFPPEHQDQAAAALNRLADRLKLAAGDIRAGKPADQVGTPGDRAGAPR